ncbi:hypothetical protein K432DRAFT_82924 [Lepidopterella palustris CBS 459.81]|uniref:Uncharacterized protein n=1 Tax=Lepidopterella palustris CBS 459.81 TaxID=1314670 RepID=A0A8E2E7Y8_9PEZI|nr:hypothetical protein K432DRAFT_82924 [Lepidopterella palustris CBS 459.81]
MALACPIHQSVTTETSSSSAQDWVCEKRLLFRWFDLIIAVWNVHQLRTLRWPIRKTEKVNGVLLIEEHRNVVLNYMACGSAPAVACWLIKKIMEKVEEVEFLVKPPLIARFIVKELVNEDEIMKMEDGTIQHMVMIFHLKNGEKWVLDPSAPQLGFQTYLPYDEFLPYVIKEIPGQRNKIGHSKTTHSFTVAESKIQVGILRQQLEQMRGILDPERGSLLDVMTQLRIAEGDRNERMFQNLTEKQVQRDAGVWFGPGVDRVRAMDAMNDAEFGAARDDLVRHVDEALVAALNEYSVR